MVTSIHSQRVMGYTMTTLRHSYKNEYIRLELCGGRGAGRGAGLDSNGRAVSSGGRGDRRLGMCCPCRSCEHGRWQRRDGGRVRGARQNRTHLICRMAVSSLQINLYGCVNRSLFEKCDDVTVLRYASRSRRYGPSFIQIFHIIECVAFQPSLFRRDPCVKIPDHLVPAALRRPGT